MTRCACGDVGDCAEGFDCVPGRWGAFCTELGFCGEACPSSLSCLPYWYGEPWLDTAYACLDPWVNLCMPCESEADCEYPWQAGRNNGSLCVLYSNNERFCGIPCPGTFGCPPDYECVNGQCVSISGFCRGPQELGWP